MTGFIGFTREQFDALDSLLGSIKARQDGSVLSGSRSGSTASASDAIAVKPLGLTVYGKSEQDGTPTPSSPAAINSVEEVALSFEGGKNLTPYPPAAVATDGGVTYTHNGDGSYTISGTATKNTYIYITNNGSGMKLPAGTYTFSAQTEDGTHVPNLSVMVSKNVSGTTTSYGNATGGGMTFTHDGSGNMLLYVYVANGNSVSPAVTVRPQLEAGASVTAPVPHVKTQAAIDLRGHAIRSLPDGTHDELTVDADGNVKLVQRVRHVADMTSLTISSYSTSGGIPYIALALDVAGVHTRSGDATRALMCEIVPAATSVVDGGAYVTPDGMTCVVSSAAFTSQSVAESMIDKRELDYKLATPVTYNLGTVELPTLPAPNVTAWAVTDPATTIALSYERSVAKAIEALEG